MRATVAFKVEDATVRNAMIAIRTAGFLTTGARGVNAPDMQPIDAARVALALMANEVPGARAADTARAAQALLCHMPDEAGDFTLGALAGLRAPFALDVAVAALISIFAHGLDKPAVAAAFGQTRDGQTTPPPVDVHLEGDDFAVITMGSAPDRSTYAFSAPLRPARGPQAFDVRRDMGVSRFAQIGPAPLMHLAEGFRGGAAC